MQRHRKFSVVFGTTSRCQENRTWTPSADTDHHHTKALISKKKEYRTRSSCRIGHEARFDDKYASDSVASYIPVRRQRALSFDDLFRCQRRHGCDLFESIQHSLYRSREIKPYSTSLTPSWRSMRIDKGKGVFLSASKGYDRFVNGFNINLVDEVVTVVLKYSVKRICGKAEAAGRD